MKFVCLLPAALLCAAALAQDSDLFQKAPPQIDDALRARIMIFYAAHQSGHFRDAMQVVAEDAQDDFIASSKDSFTDCQIKKINYSDNFTKATATTACKGEYRWHGQHMPVTIPLLSNWKVVDNKWFWWHPKATETMTPWGLSKITSEQVDKSNELPNIPKDPVAAAEQILNQISADTSQISLKNYELSKAEVHVTNGMQGGISVAVDPVPYAGLKVRVQPADIAQGQKATVTFSFDPNDPAIQCATCSAKTALPTLTANIRIIPTGQVLPVQITFATAPANDKPATNDKKAPKPPASAKK